MIQKFEPRLIGPKPWGTELLVAHTDSYTGKVLYMHAGTKGGLQYHERKDETFYLVSGQAWVDVDPTRSRTLTRHYMQPGVAFHIPPGTVHRVEAITDCTFFEVSTPHYDDRVRVEAQYGEPEGGGLPTTGTPADDGDGYGAFV
jgi:mannose-6-phosphate isomerase